MFGRRHSKKKLIGIAIALIGIGAISACHHRSPEARIDHVASKVANKLDFTTEQKVLLDDIANEIKKDMQSEKDTRQAIRNDFKSWIASDELDKDAVKGAVKSKLDRIDSIVDKYIEKVAALHKSLNAEQKKEILELMEKFSAKD